MNVVVRVTPEEAQAKYERGLILLQEMQLHRITLGLVLIDLEEIGAWEPLGFGSFPQLCQAPIQSGGFGLQERTRQTTMQVAKIFVMELGIRAQDLLDIAYSNLATVVSVVTPENILEVLADAKTLGNRDLALNKKNGKYTGGEEPFDATSEPDRYTVACPECGHTWIPQKGKHG